MIPRSGSSQDLAKSYFGLRRTIGFIGFLLPFVLVLGKIIFESSGIEGSISSYYYTVMGDVFVGSLCVIGVFLLWYRYHKHDHAAAVLAGIFAIGVALFPTNPIAASQVTETTRAVARTHVAFAALFFLTLAYMSIFLFTKTHPDKTRKKNNLVEHLAPVVVTRMKPGNMLEPGKRTRNVVYRVCGYLIVFSIALMGFNAIFKWNLLFLLETIAVMAFGFSWLVKGQAEQIRVTLRRRPRNPQPEAAIGKP